MDCDPRALIAAALLRRAAGSAEELAAAVSQSWTRIDHELAPIIGAAGVAAMYRRSLHLCAASHPVLAGAIEPTRRQLDAAPLHAVLTGLEAPALAAVSADLLQTFRELLARMLGPSLTDRLLRSIWDDFSGGSTAEDPLP
jgi:hypothetical protein